MLVTKTKKVITEEIEVIPGTYYFEDENITAYKFTLEEVEDGYSNFTLEMLMSFSGLTGIRIKEDGAWDENDLPHVFKEFILGISGKKIEKEDYYTERKQILDKLNER